MGWKCPSCMTAIAHHDGDDHRITTRYRCPVCHLELLRDEETHTLVVVALADDGRSVRGKPSGLR